MYSSSSWLYLTTVMKFSIQENVKTELAIRSVKNPVKTSALFTALLVLSDIPVHVVGHTAYCHLA